VKFGPDEAFYLLNRKGDKLRTINIKNMETLVVDVTQVSMMSNFAFLYVATK
jgi:dual oxidase